MDSIFVLVGMLTYKGDDRHLLKINSKHKALLDRLWNEPELSRQVGELLTESSDVEHVYLGQRLVKR